MRTLSATFVFATILANQLFAQDDLQLRPVFSTEDIEQAAFFARFRQPSGETPSSASRPSRRTTRSSGRRTQSSSMIGDFFGGTGTGQIVVTNFSDIVVHHTTSIGDMHRIIPGPGANPLSTATFSGGPVGADFYSGAGVPPLGDVVTGLTFSPSGQGGFVAVRQGGSTVTILPPDDVAGPGLTGVPVYAVGIPVMVDAAALSSGGAVVGRFKMAENASPMPQDRVFFNYSFFDSVALTSKGVPVHRFSPGFERTLFDSLMSIEVRMPFASTLSSSSIAGGPVGTENVELGNLIVTPKILLTDNGTLATSCGVQVSLPTADNGKVKLPDGTPLLELNNQAFHLMPFLGWLYTPSDRLFLQGFAQLDFDANGNKVSANVFGQGLEQIGRLNDPAFLYVDVSLGWRMYQSPAPDAIVTAITPVIELHYNRSLQTADAVSAAGFQIGNFSSTFEALNLVTGATFNFGPLSSFTVGYTVPMNGDADRRFDGELRAFYTRYLGLP